jgi:hypothetical protein
MGRAGIVCGPAHLDAKAVDAIDQFVTRSGSLVLLERRCRSSGVVTERELWFLHGAARARHVPS